MWVCACECTLRLMPLLQQDNSFPLSPLPPRTAAHTCRSYTSCVARRGERELVVDKISEEHTGIYICTATLRNTTSSVACQVSLGGGCVV